MTSHVNVASMNSTDIDDFIPPPIERLEQLLTTAASLQWSLRNQQLIGNADTNEFNELIHDLVKLRVRVVAVQRIIHDGRHCDIAFALSDLAEAYAAGGMWAQCMKHSTSVIEFIKAVKAVGDGDPITGDAELEGKQPSELLDIYRSVTSSQPQFAVASAIENALDNLEGLDYAIAFKDNSKEELDEEGFMSRLRKHSKTFQNDMIEIKSAMTFHRSSLLQNQFIQVATSFFKEQQKTEETKKGSESFVPLKDLEISFYNDVYIQREFRVEHLIETLSGKSNNTKTRFVCLEEVLAAGVVNQMGNMWEALNIRIMRLRAEVHMNYSSIPKGYNSSPKSKGKQKLSNVQKSLNKARSALTAAVKKLQSLGAQDHACSCPVYGTLAKLALLNGTEQIRVDMQQGMTIAEDWLRGVEGQKCVSEGIKRGLSSAAKNATSTDAEMQPWEVEAQVTTNLLKHRASLHVINIDRTLGPKAALEWAYKLWGVTDNCFGKHHPETAHALSTLAQLQERVAVALGKEIKMCKANIETPGSDSGAEDETKGEFIGNQNSELSLQVAEKKKEKGEADKQAKELWRQCIQVFDNIQETETVDNSFEKGQSKINSPGKCRTVANAKQKLSTLYIKTNDITTGTKLLLSSADLLEDLGDIKTAASFYRQCATILITNEYHAESTNVLQKYLTSVENLHGIGSLNVGMAQSMLGVAYLNANEKTQAKNILSDAKRLLEAHLGPRHDRVKEIKKRLEECVI